MELSQPDWPDQDWLSFGNAVLNQIWFAPTVIRKNFSILSRGLSTTFHHYEQSLAIDQMLLECAILQESRDEYYTVDAMKTLFGAIPGPCILQFLSETLILYMIVIWTIK